MENNLMTKGAISDFPIESYYLQKLFDSRLKKQNNKDCPKCSNSIRENYQLVNGTKEFRCQICQNSISPMSGTFFHGTHIPITKWLDITVRVQAAEREKREVMAKEIVSDFNYSLRTGYKMLSKINKWKSENRIVTSQTKFKDRNEVDVLFRMILQSSPPLFNELKNNYKN